MTKIIEAGVRGDAYQRLKRALQDRQPFRTGGTLHGGPNEGMIGRLSPAEREQFYADANMITYVVYSYATPIAWCTPDHDHFVDQSFSATTSHHQSIVRTWLGRS
jgi:hypothetical protein